MDRREMAGFLRLRRARVQPGDVGLEPGVRRRTPGLRREEVARLAGMSVDYYIRLEQGRGPRPSRQILAALARALRLTDDERAHLFNLAGERPAPMPGPPQEVPAGILHLLERLDDTPAYVLDAKYDVLAWNDMAAALIIDFSALEPRDRNPLRWLFLNPDSRLTEEGGEYGTFARLSVADLRTALGRYPDDPGVTSLVAELSAGSEQFRRLWERHHVEVRRGSSKWMRHPVVGDIEVHCDVLHVPERDQKVVLYTVEPGTPSHEAFRLLRVIGTQDLSPR
ncbi:helix-turn-helix transcriptional regulator [Actinomadura decatromicini]|uniref:Helix-turn-helix domain-containing protein n=1 Tax=Actinomadura decatromicini TaxID=2604572 RepID=A0A5D3FEA2_9ACTN|nr:helix-turn-helix transcriptional regulator [Actinomadura decatromicini]TYK46308.1 helix-turn-helix domain-containing protein [Actinomadura decatromicini]